MVSNFSDIKPPFFSILNPLNRVLQNDFINRPFDLVVLITYKKTTSSLR
jgi:hypothetical protein